MEWEKEQEKKKISWEMKERERGVEKERKEGVYVCLCVWRRLNVSTSQAETITSVGCLFLTHQANLIEDKHLKSSGNVADLLPVQSIQTATPLHKVLCPLQLCIPFIQSLSPFKDDFSGIIFIQ